MTLLIYKEIIITVFKLLLSFTKDFNYKKYIYACRYCRVMYVKSMVMCVMFSTLHNNIGFLIFFSIWTLTGLISYFSVLAITTKTNKVFASRIIIILVCIDFCYFQIHIYLLLSQTNYFFLEPAPGYPVLTYHQTYKHNICSYINNSYFNWRVSKTAKVLNAHLFDINYILDILSVTQDRPLFIYYLPTLL